MNYFNSWICMRNPYYLFIFFMFFIIVKLIKMYP